LTSRLFAFSGAALLGLAGCGQQEIRAIERLPVPASPDRGPMQVRDGDLLTDKGTRLRGATLGVDTSPAVAFDQALFDELSHESGLNAFHVYLENYEDESGANVEQADRLVEFTSKAGMYLVLGIGGGHLNGDFVLEKVRSFWDFYGPRYANRTHVIYEIQNQPELTCDAVFGAETLEMERETYARIRAVAPETHVVFFSYNAIPTAEALGGALDALNGVVNWSNASVAFHGTPKCVPSTELADVLSVSREQGIAAFASEVPNAAPFTETGVFETARVGWFNFHWVVQDRNLAAFRDGHDAAGVSWCPDFGAWPQDAGRCTAP
jgi:hypothetical protein